MESNERTNKLTNKQTNKHTNGQTERRKLCTPWHKCQGYNHKLHNISLRYLFSLHHSYFFLSYNWGLEVSTLPSWMLQYQRLRNILQNQGQPICSAVPKMRPRQTVIERKQTPLWCLMRIFNVSTPNRIKIRKNVHTRHPLGLNEKWTCPLQG